MPNVTPGSDLGTYYDNDQGKGLATIINTDDYYKNLAYLQKEKAAKQKAKDASLNKLDKLKRDLGVEFPEYINDLREPFNMLYDQAALMLTENNEDPWTSTSERAKAWRQQMYNLEIGVERVNILHDDFVKARDRINTNGDDYTDESKNAVLSFPDEFSAIDIIRGEKNGKTASIPQLQFRNPSLHKQFIVSANQQLQGLKGKDGYIDPSQIYTLTASYFGDPANDRSLNAANQEWERFTAKAGPEMQKQMLSYASMIGMENTPGVALQAYKLENMNQPDPIDIPKSAMDIAKNLPTIDVTNVREDATGLTRANRVKQGITTSARDRAASFLMVNSWMLNSPKHMAQLGIDRTKSGSEQETLNQAVDALTEMIIANNPQVKSYSSTLSGSGSGVGEEKLKETRDIWLQTLYHGTGIQHQEAAKFATFTDLPGYGKVEDMSLIDFPEAPPDWPSRYAKIKFSSEKEAKAAKEKALKEDLRQLNTWYQDPAELEAARNKLKAFYEQQSLGNVTTLPLNEANKQLFSQMYNLIVKTTKQPYEPTFGKVEDRLNILNKSPRIDVNQD